MKQKSTVLQAIKERIMNQKLTVLLALLSIVLIVCLLQKDKPPVISSSVSEPTNKFNPDPNIVYVNELYDDSNSVFRLGMTVDEVKTQLKKYNMEWSSGFDYKLAPSAIIYAKTGIIFYFNELSDNAIVVAMEINAKIPTTMGLYLYDSYIEIIKIYGYASERESHGIGYGDSDNRGSYFNSPAYVEDIYNYEMENHIFIIKTTSIGRVISWGIMNKDLTSDALTNTSDVELVDELFDNPNSVFRLGMTKDEVLHQAYKHGFTTYSYFDSTNNQSPRIRASNARREEILFYFNEISEDTILEYIFVDSGSSPTKGYLGWKSRRTDILELYGDNFESQIIERVEPRPYALSPHIFSEVEIYTVGYYYVYEMDDHMFIIITDEHGCFETWAIMSKDYYNNHWKSYKE